MKKNIRILIVILLLFFLRINAVKAEDEIITGTFYATENFDIELRKSDNTSGQLFNKYGFRYGGKTFALYCEDPGSPIPGSDKYPDSGPHVYSIPDAQMKLYRLDLNDPYEAGITKIVSGKSAFTYDDDAHSENETFAIITMALRTYGFVFGQVTSISDGNPANNYHRNEAQAHTLIKECGDECINYINELNSAGAFESAFTLKNVDTPIVWTSSSVSNGDEIKRKAIELLKSALKEALRVSTCNKDSNAAGCSASETKVQASEPTISETTYDNATNTYSKTVKYDFYISGFDYENVGEENNSSVWMKFECENCDDVEVSVSIKTADGTSMLADTDLQNFKSNGLEMLKEYIKADGNLSITIEFTASKDTYDCDNAIKYKLTEKHTGTEDLSKDVFKLKCAEDTYCQDLYGSADLFTDGGNSDDQGEGNKYTDPKEFSGEINLCEADCTELENDCNATGPDENSNECKKFHNICDSAKCNVYVSSATCSPSESELIIREGTNGNSPCDDAEVDVYSCVTKNGATDNLNNEYKQTNMNANSAYQDKFTSSSFDVSKNRFCNVACIENYHITLPPIQNDNAGRYFQISANIDGNRSCYTSEIKKGNANNPLSDDHDTFEYLFEKAREQAIEYYNLYMFYTSLKNPTKNNDSNSIPKAQQIASYEAYTYQAGSTCDAWEANNWNLPGPNYVNVPLGVICSSNPLDASCMNPAVLPDETIAGIEERETFFHTKIYYGNPQYVCHNIVGQKSTKSGLFDRRSWQVTFSYDTYSYRFNNRDNPSRNTTANIRLINGDYDKDGNKLTTTIIDHKGPYFNINCTSNAGSSRTNCAITSYGYIGDGGTDVTYYDPSISLDDILGLKSIYVEQKNNSTIGDEVKDIYNSYKYETSSTDTAENKSTNADSSIQNQIDEMHDLTNELAQCTGWNMDFNFSPTLTFDYEEEYINGSGVNKQLLPDSSGSIGSIKGTYCNGKMTYDDDGKNPTCSNSSTTNPSFNVKQNVVLYRGTNKTSDVFYVNDALTAYQTIDVSQKYVTPVQFRTLSPSGIIVLAPSSSMTIDDSLIIPGWPIEFAHQGVFTYKIQVDDLGEFNDGRLGRVWDKDERNDVVRKAEADKASDPSCQSDKSTIDDDGRYYCAYKVNCNDCPSYCDESIGICYDPDCPDCPSSCNLDEGACIVDGELNVSPRPVSPNNVNPNERPLGKNWEWDDNIDTYIELKAFVTTQEIQENGETIFEADFDANYSETNVFAINYGIKFHLTGDVINYIKNTYNRGKTYSDNSLDCYPYTNNTTGETFDGMFCYSKFIDKIIEEFPNAVEIQGTRPLPANRASLTSHSWWTTWDQAGPSLSHWQTGPITFNINSTINTNLDSLHYSTENGSQIGIGPAWK